MIYKMPKRSHDDMMEVESCNHVTEQKDNKKKRKHNTRSIACQTDLRIYSEAEVHKIIQQHNEHLNDHLDMIKYPTARWVH